MTPAPLTPKTCWECGKPFVCGHALEPCGSCWCSDFPAFMPADFSRDCRCPDCLALVIGGKIEARLATLTHAEALEAARTHSPSARLIEWIDYTREDNKMVFTRWFLLKQGSCCGNGCRNCPYPAAGPVETTSPENTT